MPQSVLVLAKRAKDHAEVALGLDSAMKRKRERNGARRQEDDSLS